MSKDKIKWDLQVIFIYYSSYADRNNYKLLKQQNYRRFLIDAECIQQQSCFAHYDIAFQKINHSAIIFKDFLRLIPEIAEIVYKNKKMNRAQCFRIFMNEHIQKLYRQILQNSQFGEDIKILFNNNGDHRIQKIVQDLTAINKMYQQHLKPYSHKDIIFIFQKLAILFKNYELCPQLISKSLLYLLYLYIIKDKEYKKNQQIYSISDLAKTFIKISQIYSYRSQSQKLCSVAKLIKLFEKIQISSGFEQLSNKIATEHATYTPGLLKPFYKAIKKNNLENDNCLEAAQQEFSKIFPSSTRHKNCGQNGQYFSSNRKEGHSKQSLKMENYMTVQSIANQSKSFLKDHKYIQKAFQQLCSYGQVANNKTLKSFKIKKLFERIGVLKLTGTAWLDIQIANLQRSSQSGKMQFLQFLELLSQTSNKILCSFDEICQEVLKDRMNLEKQRQQDSSNSYYSRPSQVSYRPKDLQLLKQILKYADKPLSKIYLAYSKQLRTQKLMIFNQMWKIMYDFEVFPTIISKNRLYQIFSQLSQVRQQAQEAQYPLRYSTPPGRNMQEKQINLSEVKKIQYSGFLMGLIQIAQQIIQPDLVPPQKLIMLLQKINESKGYKKLTSLSLVQQIRNKYSDYYLNSFKRNQKKKQQTFDELLDQL